MQLGVLLQFYFDQTKFSFLYALALYTVFIQA